jgi:hypothetical protein
MNLFESGSSSAERYMLGFFVTPAGARHFDRYRLQAHGPTWDGEILRLTSGQADAERFAVSGRAEGAELDLELISHDRPLRQRLRVHAETPDIDAGYLGQLDALDEGGADPRTAYVLEEAPSVRLDPSPTHGWGTVAVMPLVAGSDVLPIRGPFSAVQTAYSFRTSTGRHVEPTGYGHFVNHACEPSCEIAYRPDGRPVLIARRDLPAGTEITFDYTATEGQLANSFTCLCPAETHKV